MVCAWCGEVLQVGSLRTTSHAICGRCRIAAATLPEAPDSDSPDRAASRTASDDGDAGTRRRSR